LNKVCNALGITCKVSYMDEIVKYHSPKQIEVNGKIEYFKMDLILMFEIYKPSLTLDKTINLISNHPIKLSTLLFRLLKKICSLDLV
jgi:hypothetical protein